MKKFKLWIRCACFIAILLIIFVTITPVFERKTLTGAWNYTTKVNCYFNEKSQTIDVVGFGSSHMYCSLNPLVLEEQGINAYVLATQHQPVNARFSKCVTDNLEYFKFSTVG